MIVTAIAAVFVVAIVRTRNMPTWKKVVSIIILGVVCGILSDLR